MTKHQIHNPTGRKKAVRVTGGHEIIAPGKSATIEAKLTEDEMKRYKAAGLQFGGKSGETAKEPAKSGQKAPAKRPAKAPAKEPAKKAD